MAVTTVRAATDTAFQNCDCLNSITVLHTCSRKSSITPAPPKKALRQGNSMKGDFIETMQFSFTPAKLMREQVSCPSYRKTLERSGQCSGVEGSERRRQCCPVRFFAH